jgi:hypothetical protein
MLLGTIKNGNHRKMVMLNKFSLCICTHHENRGNGALLLMEILNAHTWLEIHFGNTMARETATCMNKTIYKWNKLFDKTFNHVNVNSVFLATLYLLHMHTGALNKIHVDWRFIISVSKTQSYKILSNVLTTKRGKCFRDHGAVLSYA